MVNPTAINKAIEWAKLSFKHLTTIDTETIAAKV